MNFITESLTQTQLNQIYITVLPLLIFISILSSIKFIAGITDKNINYLNLFLLAFSFAVLTTGVKGLLYSEKINLYTFNGDKIVLRSSGFEKKVTCKKEMVLKECKDKLQVLADTEDLSKSTILEINIE